MGSLANKFFPGVPPTHSNEEQHRRMLAETVNSILRGKMNCTVDVALKKDASSTTVSDERAGVSSVLVPMPTSVDGATALATWRVSTRADGSFVISHASTSTSDATATVAIIG